MTRLELTAATPNHAAAPGANGRTDPPDRYPHQLVTYLAGSPAGRVILDALLDDDVTEVYVTDIEAIAAAIATGEAPPPCPTRSTTWRAMRLQYSMRFPSNEPISSAGLQAA